MTSRPTWFWYNPVEALRDVATRDRHLADLRELIDGTDRLARSKRDELVRAISTNPYLKRYPRRTRGSLLRVHQAAIAGETNLDGKYLLRTSDPTLTPEDIALGNKQLLGVERGWRTMKQVIDLRPVYHRKEDRIRHRVTLCWLALLPIRITEQATGRTWTALRRELQRLQAITYTGTAGTFRQTTELTKTHRDLFAALRLDPPRRILDLTPTP